LPNEHGFWVMLGAVLLCALLQAGGSLRAWLAAAVVLVAGALAAGFIRKRIRRSGVAQLVSAATLAFGGAPVALAAGIAWQRVAGTVIAWMVVFVSSALLVRAAFARARRAEELRAIVLDASAIGICSAANIVFGLLGARMEALATGLTAIACAVLVAKHPSVKELKGVGLALGAIAALAAVVLGGVTPFA
jgi:hypothetical protein